MFDFILTEWELWESFEQGRAMALLLLLFSSGWWQKQGQQLGLVEAEWTVLGD